MKQFSTILNVVLAIAVAILYFLHFSDNKKAGTDKKNTAAVIKDLSSGAAKTVIAYVELDSVNDNVTFIKERKQQLEAEQKQIATEYENAYRGLENEKANFIKRGNAITQQEAEEFQAKLGEKLQIIDNNRQARGQKLAERGAKIMEDIQDKLKIFMADYNKDKRYTYILATGTGLDYLFYKDEALNITEEIITAFNEKMKASK